MGDPTKSTLNSRILILILRTPKYGTPQFSETRRSLFHLELALVALELSARDSSKVPCAR